MLFVIYIFFFFKQKTAYEMRISDWSSDVCSSDLLRFDEEQSLQPAEAFVREVVVGHIGARVQLGGEDFHFGPRRKGETAATARIVANLDLKLLSILLLHDSDLVAPISAGAIRRAFAAGGVATANRPIGTSAG